jgi:hypothetical protein
VLSDYRRVLDCQLDLLCLNTVTVYYTSQLNTTQSPRSLSTATDDSSLAHNSWHHLPTLALHFTDNFNRTVVMLRNEWSGFRTRAERKDYFLHQQTQNKEDGKEESCRIHGGDLNV